MAAPRDVIPPPTCDKLKELQLMRYTLVKFVDLKNFEEAIQGCYVRVLLEMRTEQTAAPSSSGDSYYIAAVKGAQKGPSYSGFSWDGIMTEWHIVIDLPPCFKSGPNNNIVQLNSISNSPFTSAEYNDWVRMGRESARTFSTEGQLNLRVSLLKESLAAANIDTTQQGGGTKRRRQAADEDPARAQEKEAQWEKLKREALGEIQTKYIMLPLPEKLPKTIRADELGEYHRQALELSGRLRNVITERNRCRLCRVNMSTVVCYPCKHQCMCAQCSPTRTTCPICEEAIQDRFAPFAS